MASVTTPLNPSTECGPQNIPVKKRAPRRRGKRDGPLQFQFLTATNPSHFKNDDSKRSVRSQAMIYHRNKPGRERSLPQVRAGKPSVRKGPIGSVIVKGTLDKESRYTKLKDQVHERSGTHRGSKAPASSALWDINGSAHRTMVGAERRYAPQTSDTFQDMHVCKVAHQATSDTFDGEPTESQGQRMLRIFVARLATFSQIGDGVDPFVVLPQFKNPELDSLYLQRNCIRAFSTESFHVKWLPIMLSHPHILLSSVVFASTWLDMLSKSPVDSKRTVLLKNEIIAMINERLQAPSTRLSDSTLMVMLHLLGGEIIGSNESSLRMHEGGVAQLISQRGGLYGLGNVELAETCAGGCYHGNLICEATSLSIFAKWEPSEYVLGNDDVAIPESPLFCPRADFVTVANDSCCLPSTCRLLRDMRDLTNFFIACRTVSNITPNTRELETAYNESNDDDYDARVAEICHRLIKLPSAHIPGHPTFHDWIYEACRIASLIYTASIIQRLPFSVTADPRWNSLVAGLETSSYPDAGLCPYTTRLSEALYQALERTDIANVWGNMIGVLYWVTTVGAAAARLPATTKKAQQSGSRDGIRAVWVRRCLTMFSMRTMTKLVFDHPKPVLLAQKRLLKVQELIGSCDGDNDAVGVLRM